MPNSLKCRLKKFKHQGLLSEKDLSRIYTDNDMVEELEKMHEEISKRLKTKDESQFDLGRKSELAYLGNLIDKHIAELKGEQE